MPAFWIFYREVRSWDFGGAEKVAIGPRVGGLVDIRCVEALLLVADLVEDALVICADYRNSNLPPQHP